MSVPALCGGCWTRKALGSLASLKLSFLHWSHWMPPRRGHVSLAPFLDPPALREKDHRTNTVLVTCQSSRAGWRPELESDHPTPPTQP